MSIIPKKLSLHKFSKIKNSYVVEIFLLRNLCTAEIPSNITRLCQFLSQRENAERISA